MCTNLPAAWIVPQGVVCRQRKRWENQSSSDNKRSVSVYKLTLCIDYATGCCWQARKEMGKSIKFRQQRGQGVCTNLQAAWIVPQGVVCRQGKRWENPSSSDNKEVSECVQTYRLHGLCHRVLLAGKERDGKINQVQTTKRSVSVYKLTSCMDCATGCCLQARKEMGKSIKFRQQRGQ